MNPVRLIQGDNEKGISFISQESEGSGAKHAHLRLYYMQEELQTGTAEVEWIPGAELCTDSMTKVCDEDLFVSQRANYMGHSLLSEPWRRASECKLLILLYFLGTTPCFSLLLVVLTTVWRSTKGCVSGWGLG